MPVTQTTPFAFALACPDLKELDGLITASDDQAALFFCPTGPRLAFATKISSESVPWSTPRSHSRPTSGSVGIASVQARCRTSASPRTGRRWEPCTLRLCLSDSLPSCEAVRRTALSSTGYSIVRAPWIRYCPQGTSNFSILLAIPWNANNAFATWPTEDSNPDLMLWLRVSEGCRNFSSSSALHQAGDLGEDIDLG